MVIDKITRDEKEQLRIAYRWFGHLRTVDVGKLAKLFEIFGSPLEAFDAMYKEDKVLDGLINANAIKKETKEEIMSDDLERWYQWNENALREKEIGCVTPVDDDYPSRLRELADKPLSIYYRGNIKLADGKYTIGVIGSRRPTFYGKSQAESFAGELSRRGIVIVSGMAYGIDIAGHKSVVESGGKTVAVLGGGVDICYPQTNFDIYLEMCENHLVLSEYEPEVPHISNHFPKRNRIISGLSDGLLVVEAAQSSGTMITVKNALEQGKSIYGIPGRIDDRMSVGVNKLIKEGAMLVDNPSDIVKDVFKDSFLSRPTVPNPKKTKNSKNGYSHEQDHITTPEEEKIIGMLGSEPTHMDDIIRRNKMKISETIHILGELTDKGLVKCIEKSYYIRG